MTETRLRLLCLSRYDLLGASSRVRIAQFFPALAQRGIDCTLQPLLDNGYVTSLYAGRRSTAGVLRGYLRRLAFLARSGSWDAVLLEKELFPWMPAGFDRQLLPAAPMIIDFDDAVFHNYDLHRTAWVRKTLGDKCDRLMQSAAIVLSGSHYIAERAARAGAGRVEMFPTVIDLDKYRMPPAPADGKQDGKGKAGPLTIGWIGSPATQHYLESIAPVLADVCAAHGARLLLIGAQPGTLRGPHVAYAPWSESSEARDIEGIDIGIMPLPDGPWERGKCGYKLLQYMACGKPVVASPVGENPFIVRAGVNGFLAATEDGWRTHLTALLGDPGLRTALGTAGRATVEQGYALETAADRLAQFVRETAHHAGQRR